LLTIHQPYVTELDLRHSLIPEELVDDMVKTMPEHRGPGNDEDRSLPKYDYVIFMNRLMGSPGGRNVNGANGR
jgi:hypothetical protein